MPLQYAVKFVERAPYRTYVVRFWDAGVGIDTKRVVPEAFWKSLGRAMPREEPASERERRKVEQLAAGWAAQTCGEIELEFLGHLRGDAAREMTLEEGLRWYILQNPNAGKAATIAKYEDCRKRLVAHFGARRVPSTIDASALIDYRNAMQAKPYELRNRTIKGDGVFLKQALTYLYENREKTGVRELRLLKMPRRWITKQKTLRRALTEDEIARIIRVRLPRDGDRIIRIIIYAFTTGTRRWPLLHFEKAWRDAARRQQRIPGWAMKGGEDRWGDEDFEVPICDWALEVSEPGASSLYSKWLWPNPRTGAPSNQLDRSLWAIAEAAKIDRFSLQDLRNTFASILADAGVHEQVIAVLQGHAASSVTREYIKRQPNALRNAVGVFDELRKKLEAMPQNVVRMKR